MYHAARVRLEVQGPLRVVAAGGDQQRAIGFLDEPDAGASGVAGPATARFERDDSTPGLEVRFEAAGFMIACHERMARKRAGVMAAGKTSGRPWGRCRGSSVATRPPPGGRRGWSAGGRRWGTRRDDRSRPGRGTWCSHSCRRTGAGRPPVVCGAGLGCAGSDQPEHGVNVKACVPFGRRRPYRSRSCQPCGAVPLDASRSGSG